MKKLAFSILFSFSLLATAQSKGSGSKGWLFNPYLGYESSTKTSVLIPATDYNSTQTSTPLGVRLGYVFGKFWMAADYSMLLSGKEKYSVPANTEDNNLERSTLGLNLGFRFGRFNIWGTYISSDKYREKNSLTPPLDDSYTGNGYGVGIGYQFANHFTIEIEYKTHTYTEISASNTPTSVGEISKTYSKFDLTGYAINFGFPYIF